MFDWHWLEFFIGLCFGAFLGLMVSSLLVAARRSDDHMDLALKGRIEDEQQRRAELEGM